MSDYYQNTDAKADPLRLQKEANARRAASELAPARGSAPTLKGHWRHSHGLIFCGTLRIAREDFDTNPHPDFRDKVFDEICDMMNRAQNNAINATRADKPLKDK